MSRSRPIRSFLPLWKLTTASGGCQAWLLSLMSSFLVLSLLKPFFFVFVVGEAAVLLTCTRYHFDRDYSPRLDSDMSIKRALYSWREGVYLCGSRGMAWASPSWRFAVVHCRSLRWKLNPMTGGLYIPGSNHTPRWTQKLCIRMFSHRISFGLITTVPGTYTILSSMLFYGVFS